MPHHLSAIPAAALAALILSGCMTERRVAPVAAAPSAPVRQAALAPPPQTRLPDPPVAQEPLPDEAPAPAATVPPTETALEIGRNDLLGGWALSSSGETCQIFISLTTWEGGYRASTRGCNSPQLAGISAWDLNGKTVTLKGSGATTVASLVATDAQTFNGATADGAPITVAR